MLQMVWEGIRQAGLNFIDAVTALLPRVLITLSVIVAGWLIARVVRWITRSILTRVGFGRLSERQGMAETLRAAGLPPAEILTAAILFWIVWIGFLLSGVEVLGFEALQGLVAEFARFVPRLLSGLVILVVGFTFANFVWRATLLAAVNARVPSPRVLAGVARFLVLILAGAMALDQIDVARTIVLTAFAIAFGAVMLGLAIAFGVGGGGLARRILERWFPERPGPTKYEVDHM
jgi:hypothetical protein